MSFQRLVLTSVFLTAVSANNDWSEPCLSGVCQYDIPASSGTASGTLKIWGGENAIGDITPAAGWEIIDCSPKALEQDIRLVCKEDSAADCAHLYTAGAEGKVVRLPENCGSSAFAVVTNSWVSEDQSIPSGVAASLVRRDVSAPEVKALRLTTKFDSVDTSRRTTGTVNFAIKAANVPGAASEIKVDSNTRRRRSSRVVQRGLLDFIGDTIKTITSLNQFNIDNSTKLDPINVNKTFNLIDQKVSCPPVDASLKIDVNTIAQAVATIGLAVSGTFLPPKIDEFTVITSLSAELDGSIDVAAGITGTIDSGKISLLEIPIGGIDFPGILTLGPTFQVNAQAKADLDVDIGLTVGINYKVDNAQLVFPPNSKKASGGSFNVGDTPLKLSASPNAKANGTLEAHLIPSLNLGLSALGGIVGANVFLELDGSAMLSLELEAAAEGTVVALQASKSKRDGMQIRGATKPGHYYWSPPVWNENVPVESESSTTKSDHTAMASQTSAAASHSASLSAVSSEVESQASTAMGHSSTVSLAHHTMKTLAVSSSHHAMKVSSAVKELSSTASEYSSTQTAATPSSTSTSTDTGADGSASFFGCVEIAAGLDVNAGADADFFGLFNPETKVSLFSKKFELFKKCFGSGSALPPLIAARALSPYPHLLARSPRSDRHNVVNRAILGDLLCPGSVTTAAQSVVDQIIAAADIKAL